MSRCTQSTSPARCTGTLTRLGLPQRRFHDLRHTFATLAIEAGEDIATVSPALGHGSVATTADVYMHVTPAMKDRLAQRMEDALGAQRPRQLRHLPNAVAVYQDGS